MLSPMDLVALLFITLYSFFPGLITGPVARYGKSKEGSPDNSEELWFRKEELRGAFRKNSPTSSRQ